MPTPATGSPASLSSSPAWSPSDPHKVRSDDHDRSLRQATGAPANAFAFQPPNVTPRYGMPGAAKGAIYALDPDDHTQGDALYFSRYPEVLQESIEAILASDSAPGRAYPSFQQMGAKGVQLSVDLWFCDAFMWRSTPMGPRKAAARQDLAARGRPSSVPTLSAAPLGTLAETARKFFELYMVGHDGTGVALPPVDLFLVWGGTDTPVPIVIRSVQLRMEHFTSDNNPMNFVRGGAGTPMTVSAKVDMEINIPLRAVNPFQPKKPKPPQAKKPKKLVCPNTGAYLPNGNQIIKALLDGSATPLLGELFVETGPRGFAPPSGQ